MAWTLPRTWVAGEVVTAALLNTHLRDNLNAVSGILADAAENIVNLPLNGATSFHRYTQIGKWVVGEFHLVSSGAGSGTLELSLPVTAVSTGLGARSIGTAILTDAGTAQYVSHLMLQTTSVARFFATSGATLSQATTTYPFTWAATDSLSGSYAYEAA